MLTIANEHLVIAEIILNWMGALVIFYSAIDSFWLLIKTIIDKKNESAAMNHIRGRLGYGIILGVEFLVAADIISSVIKPDYYNLGILAILVVIRTMLSFFLNKELEAANKYEQGR